MRVVSTFSCLEICKWQSSYVALLHSCPVMGWYSVYLLLLAKHCDICASDAWLSHQHYVLYKYILLFSVLCGTPLSLWFGMLCNRVMWLVTSSQKHSKYSKRICKDDRVKLEQQRDDLTFNQYVLVSNM